ncbi:hypothetical protein [Herminiimonas sp. CN]|uniref:hypothetical protein n=1 Tax=Herminiimonas sp. CN TaxID=1349818 RepID=UPI0004732F03|nr:hypothetical protein [Herminiimonas sp. CN]
MKKILANLLLGAIAFGFVTVACAATNEAKAAYKAAKNSATATYKEARAKCDALSGNPKDVCIEEAKAAEKRSKAEAEAKYKNTPKEHMKARIAAADGDYAVAKQKCNAQTGNAKDVCMEEAKAAHTKAVVDAKSSQKIGEVKSEAKDDKRDADYKVATEKCDSLAGPAKDACVAAAKSKYGK